MKANALGKILAILLILSGVLGLVYRTITYTKQTNEIKVGSLELSANEKHTVSIPVGASVGAIVIGAALLLLCKKD